MSDEAVEQLLGDARLIRHWGKLKSIRDNAAAMLAIGEEFGSFGSWIGTWPRNNIVGLWDALGERFSQMGGASGPMLLRMAGKDTFVLSKSVIAALNHWAELPPPKNRKDRAAAQACFNAWGAESGFAAVADEPHSGAVGRRSGLVGFR